MSKTKESRPLDGLTIEVQVRTPFGTPRVYPVCSLAKGLTQLTGNKTFTKADIEILETLGLNIEQVPQSLSLEELEL